MKTLAWAWTVSIGSSLNRYRKAPLPNTLAERRPKSRTLAVFSLSWLELLFCAALAIVVIGPKDLPKTARMLGAVVRTARRYYREAVGGLAKLEREIDLTDSRGSAVTGWEDFLPPEIAELRRSIQPHGDREETAAKYRAVKQAVTKAKADYAEHALAQTSGTEAT